MTTRSSFQFFANRAWRLATLIAFTALLMACKSTAPDPNLLEAIRWYTGEAGVVDDERARELLERAAADGDALSVMWMARVYSTGRMTFPADKAKAVEIAATIVDEVERLAIAGSGEANFLIGTAYAEGLGKAVDPVQAVEWYRKAAALGNTLAQHNIGNVYASGIGVPQSDTAAIEWWLIAAEKGDAIPQLRLGEVYEQGRGVNRDLGKALYWYERAASRGNADAIQALIRLQQ